MIAIGGEALVAGDQAASIGKSSCDQQAIERIALMLIEPFHDRQMVGLDRHGRKTRFGKLFSRVCERQPDRIARRTP